MARSKEEKKAANRRWRIRRLEELQDNLWEYLSDKCCLDCGEDDPIVLDFDHVRGTKVANVGDMVWRPYNWNKVVEEIAKCEIVCANCHRRRTVKRRMSRLGRASPARSNV